MVPARLIQRSREPYEYIDVQTEYVPEIIDYTYKCAVCHQQRTVKIDKVGLEFYRDNGGLLRVVCPKCDGKLGPSTIEYFKAKAGPPPDPLQNKIRTWIPLIYQESEVERFPQHIWKTHGHWVDGQKGLLFYGPARTFKSRMAYQIALAQLKLGKPVECYDPRSFRAMIERRIAEKTLWDWYEKGARTPFFLLDDLGKFRGEGKRIEEELFNLIKLRHENKLGMVITSNCTGAELCALFSTNISVPMIERLRELCKPILCGDRQKLTEETELPHVDLTADL